MKKVLLLSLLVSMAQARLEAQDVQNSRLMSQRMTITRTVGTSDVTIVYHSPTAQGRRIFGGIVPYDFVVDGKEYAWRAGSNQRTTIEFEHDTYINGNKIAAGKYGLVVMVSEEEWIFVFSRNTSWGAFQYTLENDVLRIKAEPKSEPHQEWLSYNFIDPKPEEVSVRLRWADVSAKFTLTLDVTANILADLGRKESKTTRDYRIMAIENLNKYPSETGISLTYLDSAALVIDEVEERLKQSEKFAIDMLRADLLIQIGETKKGIELKNKTIMASQGFNMYYYGLNTLIVKGDKEEAYKLLKDNMKRNPKQWQGYLALGEYYLKDGNQKKVVENFRKSYEHAPDNWKNYARYLYYQNKLILERE